MLKIRSTYKIRYYLLSDDGVFPNNRLLPVIHYTGVFDLSGILPSFYLRAHFRKNDWSNSWKAGIFTYPHYHSTSHEVMGVYKGETTLQLGGEKGIRLRISKGDVLVIPAGVAHQNLGAENAVKCVGAYPRGRAYDMLYGKASERPLADKNIMKVPLPETDPVFGIKNILSRFWKRKKNTTHARALRSLSERKRKGLA